MTMRFIKIPKLLGSLLLLGSITATAQTSTFIRPLPQLRSSWNRVVLPADIYAQLQPPFSEVRIYGKTANGDTAEAPYLVRSLKQSAAIREWSLPILNRSFANAAYFYSFQVPADSIVARIQLDFGIRNFDFQVTLEGSDNGTDWYTVLNNYRLVGISNPETNFSYSTLNFPKLKYRMLRLKVPANSDPLLSSATVQWQESPSNFPEFYTNNIQQTIIQQKKQTIIDIKLEQIMPVSAFVFELSETEPFKRNFIIEYVTDSTTINNEQQYIYSMLTASELSSTNSLLFSSNEVFAKTFRVTIENNDNDPLPIIAVKPGGFGYELLVRVSKEGNYWMSYGNKSLPAPEYDIAAFVPTAKDSFFTVVAGNASSLNSNTTATSEQNFWSSPTFLWIVMGLIILVLGWFSLSMIKNRQKDASS